MSSMRLIALLSGGDWNDANVEHLLVPEELNLEALYEEYKMYRKYSTPYISFKEFLEEKGAIEPKPNDVDEFWED